MSTAVNDYLENALALADAATKGPWFLDAGGDSGVYTERRPSSTSEDVASAFHREDEAFIAASRTLVPGMAGALLAIVGLAEWHETKAYKATAFPGEGRDAEMRAVAQAHEDAARLIRRLLEAHLSKDDNL